MTAEKKQPAGAAIGDVWKRELATSAPPEVEPVEMTFDGLPCRVRPIDLAFYVRSGRMPDYLARITFHDGDARAAVDGALAAVSTDDVLAGAKFQRLIVCRALDEPRVVDAPEGEAPEGAFTFMELSERRPAFIDAVFFWILNGCPVRKEGEEGKGLDAEALETFPESKPGKRRSRARHHREADGPKPLGDSAQQHAPGV